MNGHVVTSLLLIPVFVLVCPLFDQWVVSRMPLLSKMAYRYIVAFLFFFMGMLAKPDSGSSMNESNKSTTSINEPSDNGKVTFDLNGNRISNSQTKDTKEENKDDKDSKIISGIEPVDVYGNFEKIGFITSKNIDADGATFINTSSSNGIDFNVETYCESGVNDVTSISLQATKMYPQNNKVGDMKSFLKYGCSIPYDGAEPEKVSQFIDNNYFNNKASIIISGVKFTIYCPTEFARLMVIERN
jgi:hypothetical protein